MSKKKRKYAKTKSGLSLVEEAKKEEDKLYKIQVRITQSLALKCKDMKFAIRKLINENEKLKRDNRQLKELSEYLKEEWRKIQYSSEKEMMNEIKLLTIENKNIKKRLSMLEGGRKLSFLDKLYLLFFKE